MSGIEIISTGMVCAVGMTAERAAAAIRAGISGLRETSFSFGGKNVNAGAVPLLPIRRGVAKLMAFLALAIRQCLVAVPGLQSRQVALLVTVTETGRPGRFNELDATLLDRIQDHLGTVFHSRSRVITAGKLGGVQILDEARHLLSETTSRASPQCCIVAGVDTWLVADALAALLAERRLYGVNDDGILPGEGGAAVLVGRPGSSPIGLTCVGIGRGVEPSAVDPTSPLRGEGMKCAFHKALTDADCDWTKVDYRIADLSGEHRGFKEAALALSRSMRSLKPHFPLWHPADCTGDLGAATLPALLCLAHFAAQKGYAPGPGVLIHLAGDDGGRAAVVARTFPSV